MVEVFHWAGGEPPVPTRHELEDAGIRIVVGIPMERTISAEAFPNFWNVARHGWPIFPRPYTRTDVNRNEIVHALLDSDFTHVMMLDLDQIHPEDVIERQARWMLADPSIRIVSGLHYRRGEPYDPLAFVQTPDGGLHSPVDIPSTLFRAHTVGHGSLLVSRTVFDELPMPWWAYQYGRSGDYVFPSEDMFFCLRCQDAGIKIWVDPTVTSPHLITGTIDGASWQRWIQDHADAVMQHGGPVQALEEVAAGDDD